jgi:hypothetical protein
MAQIISFSEIKAARTLMRSAAENTIVENGRGGAESCVSEGRVPERRASGRLLRDAARALPWMASASAWDVHSPRL